MAVAVDRIPPHQPPPAAGWADVDDSAAAAAFFSVSGSSELAALGVKLVLRLLALSVDLRAAAAVFSSMAGDLLPAVSLSRGVCGREEGSSEASCDSRSARISSLPFPFGADAGGLEDLGTVFLGLVSSPMPEKRSSRLSSAWLAFVFLGGIVKGMCVLRRRV